MRDMTLAMSRGEKGYQPSKWKMFEYDIFARAEMTPIVKSEHMETDAVTKRMRARMTEGASRERVGDGRVVEER